MARYKVLKSVAHGLAQSFVSNLNYRDYGVETFRLDLMDGTCEPEVLATPPIRAAAEQYSKRVPELITAHGSDMEFVGSAHLEVRFDLHTQRQSKWSSELESPFTCRVVVTDDRGKAWSSQVEDWWFPEPPSQGAEPTRLSNSTI